MKLMIVSAAIALGFSVSAFAAQPATDHSQHQQHQQQAQPAAPPQSQSGGAARASHGHMQHHQGMGEGMKTEGCCCCKKNTQGQMSCDHKGAAPAAGAQDHSKH